MDRGAWQATVHGVAKESDMTQQQTRPCGERGGPNKWASVHLCQVVLLFVELAAFCEC